MLHFVVNHVQQDEALIAAVNWEGKTCRFISWPRPSSHVFHWAMPAYVGQSQGRLCCMGGDIEGNSARVTIWVLEDYDKEEWVKKHTVSYSHLFGISRWQPGFDYNVVAIHPDRNLVFIVVRR
ncbi:hypothetical protein BS78_02G061600 [Paspalum vaginatum]|nr:hypothetical protein BS78_02G061600 [Paspalum vaginatum]